MEAMCSVENKEIFGAASTGYAPTTSEWSTILLPIKVRLILEVLKFYDDIVDKYFQLNQPASNHTKVQRVSKLLACTLKRLVWISNMFYNGINKKKCAFCQQIVGN